MTEKKELVKGYVAVSEKQKSKHIAESFKGEVTNIDVRFPKKLGIEHPFNFEEMEQAYNSIPIVKAAVDKHVDSIVSDFTIEAKNKKIKTFIEGFLKDTNFLVFLRQWILNGLVDGNGFAEIDLGLQQVRVLDPKSMYVKRDSKGVVKGYTQFTGMFNKIGQNKKNEPIPFTPEQIAHLKVNTLSDEAYGKGLIYPNRRVLDFLMKNEIDQHRIVSRKAGAPYHAKVGVPGERVNRSAIDDFNQKLEYLNNRTEWVTDANVDIKKLDFGDLGENFSSTLKHDVQMLIFGFEVPSTLLGVEGVPEGLAKVQLESFQRRIKSLQEATEKVIEEKIFRPLLNENGLDGDVEVVWQLPGETEINNRIDKLTNILSTKTTISENMRRLIEIELADTLNLKDADKYLPEPNVDLKKQADIMPDTSENVEREEEETEIEQPEVPGEKPNTEQSYKMKGRGCGQQLTEKDTEGLTVREWIDLKEIAGLNFADYLANILINLRKDPFKELAAVTDQDLALGLLPPKDIEKLRIIMREGFQQNRTIREIQDEIEKFIKLPDRFVLKDGQKVLKLKAPDRPNAIARTETVRLANKGLLKTYEEHKIDKVRFLAALSERTCPECDRLNGRVFELKEADNVIPVHTSCRCTWVSVV